MKEFKKMKFKGFLLMLIDKLKEIKEETQEDVKNEKIENLIELFNNS